MIQILSNEICAEMLDMCHYVKILLPWIIIDDSNMQASQEGMKQGANIYVISDVTYIIRLIYIMLYIYWGMEERSARDLLRNALRPKHGPHVDMSTPIIIICHCHEKWISWWNWENAALIRSYFHKWIWSKIEKLPLFVILI